MKRRSVLFGIGLGLLLVGVGAVLVLLLLHEPAVYARGSLPEGEERKQLSGQFNGEFLRLYDEIRNEPAFGATFTQESINSYFDEDFVRMGVAKSVLPEGVSAPRVQLPNGHDPASFFACGGDASQFQSLLESARP